MVLTYAKGSVSGYLSTESFCLAPNITYCADDQQFIAVTEAVDLTSVKSDGIFGLAPVDNLDKTVPGRSSFLQNLKEAGVIEENVFSFYLTGYDNYLNTSMFTIGGYDLETYAPNSTVTWNYIENTSYWTVKLSDAMIGNQTIPLSTQYAVVDTGTSYLAMPTTELQFIV